MKKRIILLTVLSIISHYVMAQNVFPTNGTVVIDGHSLKVNYPNTTGGWARGFGFYDSPGTNQVAGMGLKGSSTNLERFYIAYGANPWSSGLGLYIQSNGNVGIGTSTPERNFVVQSNRPRIALAESGGDAGVIELNEDYNQLRFQHWTNFGQSWDGTLMTLDFDTDNIGIGTISPDEKLTVAGSGKFQEIIVEEDTGADFVFEEGYDLPELSELEAFIRSNKHLPEIPTAEQMKKEGIKVGELQIKLLQKIEELTLYTIEQEKRLGQQQKIIDWGRENEETQNEMIGVLLDQNKQLLKRIEQLESKQESP